MYNLQFIFIYLGLFIILLLVVIKAYQYIKQVQLLDADTTRLKNENAMLQLTRDELKLARDQAEESDRLKTAFLANMSHEIRTPLNAIMGFSSLLQDDSISENDKQEFYDIIHSNSNRLLDLIDEIFDIAQLESGLISLQKEPVQLNELLTGLITHFNIEKGALNKEHIAIRLNLANKDRQFTMLTDGRMLRQTLTNLIENALKYTHEGSIETGYDFNGNKLRFFVRDTGIGFPQEKLDVLFQRFRQNEEDPTRQYGGVGLGLTLSKKYIEIMGGKMWAESTQGNGSAFFFTIPYEALES
ncbi:MAG: hypothetical protein KUL83_01570 [Lentimicrobium sp.]|jgi:signal transduction histidine kinase|nr:hypothetical protein [Lentimicrobium sp.]MDD2526452.1 ATP-binding protein [Lentimicrobiaceae bacterium]MDD4596413.1 ATP-binding protein [Lentimicrobiaceae bacterium]MDY0026502.1 ATP-binding protein [Lentimicrobium sp.]